jgi:hypothetical protein
MNVRSVSVDKPNHSYTETEKIPPSLANLHDKLTMLKSGYNAVFKETGDPYAANMHFGVDLADIDALFETLSIPAEEQATWMKKATSASMGLIEQNWTAVKKVAEELLKSALLLPNGQSVLRMNGGRVVQIVREQYAT